MSRRGSPDLEAAADRVDRIMRMGYYIDEFSPYHIRIQDAVDYWPTSGRWRAPKGDKFDNNGIGMKTLKAYLREYHPIDETTESDDA